jgi:hypothetical protein
VPLFATILVVTTPNLHNTAAITIFSHIFSYGDNDYYNPILQAKKYRLRHALKIEIASYKMITSNIDFECLI